MEAWCEGMMDQGRWDGEVWMSDEDTRKAVAASVKKARMEEEEEDEDPRNIYKPSRSGRSHGKLIAIDDEHEDPGVRKISSANVYRLYPFKISYQDFNLPSKSQLQSHSFTSISIHNELLRP